MELRDTGRKVVADMAGKKVYFSTAGAIASLVIGLGFLSAAIMNMAITLVGILFMVSSVLFLLHAALAFFRPSVVLLEGSVIVRKTTPLVLPPRSKRVDFGDVVELRRVKGSVGGRIEISTRNGATLSIPGSEMFSSRFNELHAELKKRCAVAKFS